MTHSRWRAGAAAAFLMLATQAAAQDISVAETLLFQTRHLGNVRAPATLRYSFHKAGSVEPGFDDRVLLVLSNTRPAATLQFLTGPREYTAPAVDEPEGNPVLLGFLEHDIAGMQRLTGGASAYFRKRIRLALAGSAQVRAHHFTYDGKEVDGREIVIEPYANDPMRARFEQYVGKRYTFIVSPQVPGGVYQVRAAAGSPALVDETLTLVGADH
ncbi:hypothetical protein [Massilia sp. S19_KUP03_FR1]|uniref:hypothetical protein n=1 Tax=Massilia sp. S19_KUP03_FR1 TaxID=3025503 RepID=UPI002FCDA175